MDSSSNYSAIRVVRENSLRDDHPPCFEDNLAHLRFVNRSEANHHFIWQLCSSKALEMPTGYIEVWRHHFASQGEGRYTVTWYRVPEYGPATDRIGSRLGFHIQ